MIQPDQAARASRFRDLNPSGRLLLPNAWDAACARVFEAAGFPAIGTTSGGVANAGGLPDNERIGGDAKGSRDHVASDLHRPAISAVANLFQTRELFGCEEILQPDEQGEVSALDVALQVHHAIGLLENLRFVHRRASQQCQHLLSLLSHLPLPFQKLRLRLEDLSLDGRSLLLLKSELVLMGHDQVRREQMASHGVRVLRRLLTTEGQHCGDDHEP